MKQIYISSTMVWNATLEDMYRLVAAYGLGGIEWWAQHMYCRQYDETEYRRLSDAYSLRTAVHSCSWDLNLSSMNEAVRKTSVEEVVRSMQLAKRLGAEEVTVHPGHMTMQGWRKPSIALMKQSLQEIADASYRMNMPVSLEIMEKTKKEIVTDMAAMQEVTGDLFSFFSYTVDVAHCDSAGEVLYTLNHLPRVSKIHISNRMGQQYHTPLDEGDYDFSALLPSLYTYGIPLVVEGYDPDGSWNTFHRNMAFLAAQQEHGQYYVS